MFRATKLVVRNSRSIKELELRRFDRTFAATSTQIKAQENARENLPGSSFSFAQNLFRGEVQPAQIFPYPTALNQDQLEYVAAFMGPVTRFFEEQNDPVKNDAEANIPSSTLDGLWELGGFALQVPEKYGGMACNNSQYLRLGEIIGMHDLGLGICLGAHQSIGFKGILLFGTDDQKDKYLPQVTTGKVYAAFALTEPSSGSDAASIKTRAVKSQDGKHFIMNGSKIWISNGGIADIFTVFAKTEVDDPKTGKKKDKITAFIVERGFGGVTSGPPENKMGIKCSNTTEVYFEEVKVPVENVLGGEGNGFKVAMQILNNGRFGMAGTMSGTMNYCIKKATEHATNRLQFGRKIENFGSIQEKLARMAMHQYATQSMAYMVAANMDLGSQDYHLEAAISKIFGSESAWYVCDEAIQILGGMGFMKEAGLERFLRDLRIFRIFEGTNDILRLFVALTGIQYAGGHLKELQRALKNPTANLGFIVRESSKRAIRNLGYGGVDMTSLVNPKLADASKLCAQCVGDFGKTVESLLIKYGKGIIDEQFLLKLLADSTIDIYAMASCLSRSSRSLEIGLDSAEHERTMTEAWCVEAADRVQNNLRKINSPLFVNNFKKMSQVSLNICGNLGVIQQSPLGL